MSVHTITKDDWNDLRYEARRRARLTLKQHYIGCWKEQEPLKAPATKHPATTTIELIPEEKWKDLIHDGQGTFLADRCRGLLPPHDQRTTSRCWVHGSVRAAEVTRLWQNCQALLLSPDSVAYPIDGLKDRGGYPQAALNQMISHGACPQSMWPEGQLGPGNAHPNWKEERLHNTILDWTPVTSWQEQITLAINHIPVALPLNWWGHLVCQLDPVILPDGEVGIGFDNSWGPDWGDNGYAHLDRQSGTTSHGAWAPISVTFKHPDKSPQTQSEALHA